MTSSYDPEVWATAVQAAQTHRKSVETIRKWGRTEYVRTCQVGGLTRYHIADLAAYAKTLPAPPDGRRECARAGHRPTYKPDAWGPGEWTTLRAAAETASRTRQTLIRWADEGHVGWSRCLCGYRLYIWRDSIEAACNHYKRKKINS